MEQTTREQHLRNEVGQLTHKIHQMIDDRKVMHADLVAQRADIQTALNLLELGTVRDAIQVLKDVLAHRGRTREPRKNRTVGAAA
jgi:hypothetical protein